MTQSEFINQVIGRPWADRSCNFDTMDCWGLVILYYRHVMGIELHHVADYEAGSDFVTCHDSEATHWQPVGVPDSGDIAVFYHGNKPQHIGIIISPGKCLHSRGENGCVMIDNVHSMKRIYKTVEYKKHGSL